MLGRPKPKLPSHTEAKSDAFLVTGWCRPGKPGLCH